MHALVYLHANAVKCKNKNRRGARFPPILQTVLEKFHAQYLNHIVLHIFIHNFQLNTDVKLILSS